MQHWAVIVFVVLVMAGAVGLGSGIGMSAPTGYLAVGAALLVAISGGRLGSGAAS